MQIETQATMLLLLLQQKIMPKGFVLSWMQGMEEVTEVQAAICDAGRNDSLGRYCTNLSYCAA
ncbi:hypothetical protein V1224_14420 [Lachnospiraceae bacterium JLR.KK008]